MTRRAMNLGSCASLACLWEATAAKPGNVYRGADFADMTFADFQASAVAIGPVFDAADHQTVGRLVLTAVEAMRTAVAVNTHLGTILLLAPLAKAAAAGGDLFGDARRFAEETTIDDARCAYAAIRRATPGGLGKVDSADVEEEPRITLHQAMQLAADRDLVARQYVSGFADVHEVAERIEEAVQRGTPLADAIVQAHVWQMARCPDSLIARKCGAVVAQESADRAAVVLEADDSEAYHPMLADLDFWLRADGHRRNPGTTADLIAGALFCLMVEGGVAFPVQFYGQRHA